MSFDSIDEMRAEAERRRARRAAGKPLHDTPEELVQKAKIEDERLESEIQAECVRHYRANGFIAHEGLKERRKTRIDKGHPDIELFHLATKWHGYHEVKVPGGRLRPDQRNFQEWCIACEVPHFVGGMEICELVIELVLDLKKHRGIL
jgi:hypothetical protein